MDNPKQEKIAAGKTGSADTGAGATAAADREFVISRTFDAPRELVWKAWTDPERMKHGALDYKECVGEDLKTKWGIPFPRMMRLKPGETVVFSYVVFKSRAHRDRVNARVMKEMEKMGDIKDMPFDVKRMVYGGFKAFVEA